MLKYFRGTKEEVPLPPHNTGRASRLIKGKESDCRSKSLYIYKVTVHLQRLVICKVTVHLQSLWTSAKLLYIYKVTLDLLRHCTSAGCDHLEDDVYKLVKYYKTVPMSILKINDFDSNIAFPSKYFPSPITKICLYNFDPLKLHFYTVNLGFTGVYIIVLISAQKHRLWVLLRTASLRQL